ncbi:MAG TPA: T9SS type A sorting domain-containing protein, partial [Flavobacteriales bacterium]|nr:T9SS type A sorting domain-containing protein [Flavobacteriales bacterium]
VVIHNDVLYIVGAFREPGAPGNGLAAFDGQNWLDFGTGLELAIAPGYTSVLTLQWFHDDLYVGGQFTKAGGIPANGLAKWNGSQWCSLPGFDQEPGPNPQSVPGMAVWRDSLYIVGAFTELEGQPFNRVAQWIGGDAVSGCSVPISVPEISTEHVQLSVWLTDVNNWTVEMPYNERWSVTLYDNTGRTVQRQNVAGQRSALDLSGLSAGMYIVQAGDPSGKQFTAKLLMQ